MNYTSQAKKIASKPDKIYLPSRLSGLAKSHRLIMVEKHKEIQFMILCEQIRLNDFKKQRAEHQKDERREKRLKKVTVD